MVELTIKNLKYTLELENYIANALKPDKEPKFSTILKIFQELGFWIRDCISYKLSNTSFK